MWEFLGWLYNQIVYYPQLNLLELLYLLTNDIGWSIVILSILINLLLFPLFSKNYLNSQKLRLLQPKLKELQEQYRHNPVELINKTKEFYHKHDIKTGYTFLILILQILFASGLFYLTNNLSHSNQLTGLYEFFFDRSEAQFSNLAFGVLEINRPASAYLWLPIIVGVLSYLLGMYMFRWGPKIPVPETKNTNSTEPQLIDPEALQKSLEWQSIYFFPAIVFVTTYVIPTGVAIYILTTSALALVRQIYITYVYKDQIYLLAEAIAKTDPMAKDDDPSNNLEADLQPNLATTQPLPTLIQTKTDKKPSNKSSKSRLALKAAIKTNNKLKQKTKVK
jgi:YidC/Oxa1 family membrane protein insertase